MPRAPEVLFPCRSDTVGPVTNGVAAPARPGIPGRRLLFALLVIFLVAVIPSVVRADADVRATPPELRDLGDVPAFSLIDERGQPFTEDALRGHPTIVSFVFTRCDTICPVITMKMQRAAGEDRSIAGGAAIKLALDLRRSRRTTRRPRLADVRGALPGATPTRWRFVTGPRRRGARARRGPVHELDDPARASPPSGAPAISHSGYFVLVDGDLAIRGVYDSNDVQRLDELMRDARYLARTHRAYKFGGGPSPCADALTLRPRLRLLALNIGFVVVGIAILYWGAEWLIRGSAAVARAFGVKPLVDRAHRRRVRHVGAGARGRDEDRAHAPPADRARHGDRLVRREHQR